MAETPKSTPSKSPRKPRNAGTRKAKPAPRKPEGTRTRSVALGTLSIGAIAGVVAAGVFGALRLGRRNAPEGRSAPQGKPSNANEHVPVDLLGETHPDGSERAAPEFRPDPTAPVSAAERDQFRPALAGASAPTLVAGQSADNARFDAAPS
jgi:hypothetical protein